MKVFSLGDSGNNVFLASSHVFFSQCSKNKKLSLTELLRLTSDIAVEDFAQRGLTREFLAERNIAILVSRTSFKIHKMPEENQDIKLFTCEEKPEAFQLLRSYEIKTENGEPLVSGLSTWIVVDIASRRIIPTKNFTLREEPTKSLEHDCEMPNRIAVPSNAVELCRRKVGYSDLDSNGHVNNSRYGNYILDALPEDILEQEISEFKINYSKEAFLGEEMTIIASFSDDRKKVIVAGRTERGTSFESLLAYK